MGRRVRRSPPRAAALYALGLLAAGGSPAAPGDVEPFRLLGLSAAEASAAAPESRSLSIQPSLAIDTTLTDNRKRSASERQSDWIAAVTPGLWLVASGGAVRGHLDYSLSALTAVRDRQGDTLQNSLHAAMSVEAVEKLAYLDLAGSIERRSVSAFGAQAPADSLSPDNANSSEVATYRLSPYLRRRVGNFADVEARLTHEITHAQGATGSDSGTDTALLRLAQDSAYGRFGWGLEALRERVGFQAGRATVDQRARVLLTWFALPELRLAASGGREANDYAGDGYRRANTAGLGLVWKPGERTQLIAEHERRLDGAAHTLVFEHRMRRSVWRLSDTRDASADFGRRSVGSQGSTYDLLYAQFASREPDPVLRAQAVREYMRSNGIAASAGLPGGALPAALTDERQQSLSVVWLGLRDTLSVNATRNVATRLDAASTAVDDFSARVRQQGVGAEMAHRLSERGALNLAVAQIQTRGDSAGQANRLRSLNLVWSGKIDARLGFALGLRHASFASDTVPYTESALTAGLRIGF